MPLWSVLKESPIACHAQIPLPMRDNPGLRLYIFSQAALNKRPTWNAVESTEFRSAKHRPENSQRLEGSVYQAQHISTHMQHRWPAELGISPPMKACPHRMRNSKRFVRRALLRLQCLGCLSKSLSIHIRRINDITDVCKVRHCFCTYMIACPTLALKQ